MLKKQEIYFLKAMKKAKLICKYVEIYSFDAITNNIIILFLLKIIIKSNY